MKNNVLTPQTAIIGKLYTNCLGTADIPMKGPGMRKEQDFTVYPISKTDPDQIITIQSPTRIGRIDLKTGRGQYTPAQAGGAYNHHFALAQIKGTMVTFQLQDIDTQYIKMYIFSTAAERAGNKGIISDNSGAVNMLSI